MNLGAMQSHIAIEQSLLGAILNDGKLLDVVSHKIKEADFIEEKHQLVYRIMRKLAASDVAIDILTVSDEYKRTTGELETHTQPYIAELAYMSLGGANIELYAEITKKYSALRQLKEISRKAGELAENPGDLTSEQIIEQIEHDFYEITQERKAQSGLTNLSESLPSFLDTLDKKQSLAVPTGFVEFDKMLCGGLLPGQLCIIAGRPGMGKTTLAMNIAEQIAKERPVFVFSMEMETSEILGRMLSSLAQIQRTNLDINEMKPEEILRLTSFVAQVQHMQLMIDDSGYQTPSSLRSKCRKAKRDNPNLGLIVVDYLQLIKSERNYQNRTSEISEISASLKALAKELKVPIIALAQLNRQVESKTDNKRPNMSHLRESGSIEQDADIVVLIYRDDFYNTESPDKGLAEIIIDKHRNGETGMFKVIFQKHYNRFINYKQYTA